MPIVNVDCSMGRFSNIGFRLKTKFYNLFKRDQTDIRQIPIILNNFNRLEYLKKMIDRLQSAGYKNIFIIDNNSTYSPLLKYYSEIPYTVFKLNKNVGFLALWKSIIYTRFSNAYYVYSDADILPIMECPNNFMQYFKSLLENYKNFEKVGFGLSIDDIPDYYPLKQNVINWERKFWSKELESGVYEAPIDTTFALYRPGTKGGSELKAIRTGYPYLAHHLSWYINPNALPDDELFYQRTTSSAGSWTNKLTGKSTTPNY